jgi:3-hydroxybutyryl-CoA dehydrogenase
MSRMNNITVLGAGMMGPGIAQLFAVKGYSTTVWGLEKELPGVIDTIRSNLLMMAGYGIGQESAIEPAITRIGTTSSLEDAVAEADFVVEAIVENLEIKQEFFRTMDSLCNKNTILATNTSVISPTEIALKSKHRERIVGTHFWNPPHLIPLVEVVKARDTSEETVDRTMDLMADIGKKPVRVKKDVPGFLANRLQHALWREAISIVEKGIANPEDVDEAVKNSFGLRLPVLGPLENADLVGLDLTLAIHNYVLKHIEDSHMPSPVLKEKVDRGELGIKTGKGFKQWSKEGGEALRKRLAIHLMKWMKEHGNKT